MSDYNIKRTAAFALSLAAVFGATALFYGIRSGKYERNITAYSENALSTLISSTEQMQQGLKNMQYGTDGVSLASSAARVWSASQSAIAALSCLPLDATHLMQCEKLFNQAGEYALSLMVGASGGTSVTDSHVTSLKSIRSSLEKINAAILSTKEKIDIGEISIGAISGNGGLSTLAQELAKLEDDFPSYEPLNYDGAYSEHMGTLSPLYLESAKEASPEEALKIAAELMGVDAQDMTLLYETNGTIPTYGYGNDTSTVEITKNGGIVLTLYNRRDVNAVKIPESMARQYALQAAEKLGFAELNPRYSSQTNNILTVELIASYNDITIYPDRVTVGIALDNGQVVFLSAKNYIMSHTERQITLPSETPEGARLALIPTDGLREHLCFEYEEDDHLRFMCAETGSCYAIHPFDEGEKEGLISD